MKMRSGVAVGAVIAAVVLFGRSAAAQRVISASDDSAAVTTAVANFHRALARGDSAAALALLDEGALILEGGDLETRAEYRSHHLAADIEFAGATRGERRVARVVVLGDAAWVIATSETRGSFHGRDVASEGAETMVLARTAAGWRIATVHWSSHRAAPRPAAR